MKKSLALLLVFVLAVLLGTPFCRYGIVGLVRGESFYRGMPASYWRGAVKEWAGLLKSIVDRGGSTFSLAPPAPPLTYLEEAQAFLDRLLTREIELPPDEKDLAALPVYIELLGDEDADVRWYAARVTGDMGPPAKAAVPRLAPLLQDDDAEVRQVTILAIASIEGRAAVPRLAPLLQDSDPEIRRWTAIALGPIEGGVDLVLPLMKDREPLVRRRVANLLGESGQKSEAVISALREALDDPDEQVRAEAAQALKTLKG